MSEPTCPSQELRTHCNRCSCSPRLIRSAAPWPRSSSPSSPLSGRPFGRASSLKPKFSPSAVNSPCSSVKDRDARGRDASIAGCGCCSRGCGRTGARPCGSVQPDTVVRWHRRGWRIYWRWKSRPPPPGRPRVPRAVQALIRQMCRANPTWGAPRIHGERLKLGMEIAETTVGHYLVRPRRPPSQTWRTFLTNHVGQLEIDFFVVPTLTCRVLFVFIVLAHERRRILHVNVTDHPTAEWTAQQLRNAFPWDTAPRFLLRDRDKTYRDASPVHARPIHCLLSQREDHLSLAKDAPTPRGVQAVTDGEVIAFQKSAACTIATNDAPTDVTSSGLARQHAKHKQTCLRASCAHQTAPATAS